MHVFGFPLDLNWFIQFVVTALVIALGLRHLVKNTASKCFTVDDASFGASSAASTHLDVRRSIKMPDAGDACAVCGNLTKKQCSGCKLVRYCSSTCQISHWNSGHGTKCKDFKLSRKENAWQSADMHRPRRGLNSVALVPDSGTVSIFKQSKEILFPYEDFVGLFYWDKSGFPPCGLLNCGNSCFANVVLQCLSHTRPLVAYLLERGHRRECRRNDWCFLCEFQTHIEKAGGSQHPFSPLNILSRLPNIGGNLGYGKQEDAHEFMRFAIDAMQSVCLDEYGGEKALHPSTQETTLVQHIFGGHLQSQVICTKCNNMSNQYENMMDLTVEINGDATSLEECLDQFTVREQLHGDNMYKCDGCNDYVMAWKRLTVRTAPNILTIALKRFQTGRFGKLNKRVTFPETLDLGPYMSEAGDGNDVYKLYAVVVHVDMLNASFFGHYICYTKDFSGNWYRIDDCKVTRVDVEELLSQGAYMLFYSRVSVRKSSLKLVEPWKEDQTGQVLQEEQPLARTHECFTGGESVDDTCSSGSSSDINFKAKVSTYEKELSARANSDDVAEDTVMVDSTCEEESSVPIVLENEVNGHEFANTTEESASPNMHSKRLVSGIVASASETFMSGAYSLHSESTFCNSGVDDEYRAENGAQKLTDSYSKSSLPMQNGLCEEVATSRDGGLSSNAFLDDMNPVISETEPKRREFGKGLFPSTSIKDAAASGAMLKPLFAPGFLGKRPSIKSMKKVGEAPPELGEFASPCNLNKGSSVSEKYGVPHQNGEMMEKVKAAHSIGTNPLPSTSFEVVGNCLEYSAENGAQKLTDSSSKSSLPMQDGFCEEVATSRDGGLSSDDFLDDTNPVISETEPKRREFGKGLFPSTSIKDAASSGAKLKPLFAPGFLGKRPSIESMKKVGEAPPELGEFASPCNLNNGSSVSAKYGVPHKNGAMMEKVKASHSIGSNSLPSTPFEVVGNCLDAAVPSTYGEFTNLCNGDLGAFVIPDGGIGNIDADDQPLVDKSLSYNADLH